MRKIIIFSSLLACLCACRNNSSDGTRFRSLIAPYFPGLDSNDSRDLSGEMESTCYVMENPFGGPRYNHGGAPDHFDSYMTTARFCNSSGYPVRASNVKLNGIPVNQDDKRRFRYCDQSFGITHHWQVTPDLFGFGSVPAMSDSVLAPNYYRVTYPRPIIDTVSKSAGFTCSYDNPGTDSVTLIIGYDSVMTTIVDRSNHPSYVKPRGWVSMKASNTGSYFVSSSMISSFPSSGVIEIWINTFRRKIVIISGRRYLLLAGCRARTYCFIKS